MEGCFYADECNNNDENRRGIHKMCVTESRGVKKDQKKKLAGDTHWSKLLQTNVNMLSGGKCKSQQQIPIRCKKSRRTVVSDFCHRIRAFFSPSKNRNIHDLSLNSSSRKRSRTESRFSTISHAEKRTSLTIIVSCHSSSDSCSVSSTPRSSPFYVISNGASNATHLPGRKSVTFVYPEEGSYSEDVTPNYHLNLTTAASCPPKPIARQQELNLCDTWPPTCRKSYDRAYSFEDDDSVFSYDEIEGLNYVSQDDSDLRESLGDCTIQYEDIDLGECVHAGRRESIYRGRWHGEVTIHTYEKETDQEVTSFLEDVNRLSMIRHENIALFMGACIDRPRYAVVTSIQKGVSLYEQIHIKGGLMSVNARIHVARQIAQGMGYLHAKGVIMQKLNSKNIFLESKVKISVMDYGMSKKEHDRMDYACLPKGHLTYVAPELICQLSVYSPRLVCEALYTKETDIFAFGTVLYELFTGSFPFSTFHPHTVIYMIGSGSMPAMLKSLKFPATFKKLIKDCWNNEPMSRLHFIDIGKAIARNTIVHKRHSSSEPERLNQAGLNKSFYP